MSYKDIISSATGSAIAEFITLPICTIKTNYQVNTNHKSIFGLAQSIYYEKGIRGFYTAQKAAIGVQIVSMSSKYASYNKLKQKIPNNSYPMKIFIGVVAGGISTLFSHPIDVVKVTQQQNLSFVNELKKNGMNMFYRGYSKALSKSILLTSTLFPLKDYYETKTDNIYLSSGLASLTATTIIHPIDYLKVRSIAGENLYIKYNGIHGLVSYYYRGFGLNLARVLPHFIITISITEKLKKMIF